MANPSTTLRNVEETLRSVIVSLIDDQKGFQQLGENLKNSMVRRYFLVESLKRAQFRGEIESMLHQEGMPDLSESGSVSGAILRAWSGLQAAMHQGDHALLATALHAEDEVVHAYRDALDNEIPLPVRQVLSTQAARIENSLDCLRTMVASSR